MIQTLRDIAITLSMKNDAEKEITDKAILILGASVSGKSSIIAQWLGKNPANGKRAPGIEYSWSRKTNKICHIWEMLETISPKVISTILKPERQFKPVLFLIVFDLSRPNSITLDAQQIFNNVSGFSPENIIIIGSKYDIFQNLESEMKKNVCKFLRGIALLKSAHLIFYSHEIPALVKRFGELLNSIIWSSGNSRAALSKDYHTPLYITPSSDSWSDLGINECSLEQLCNVYNRQF